jgi:hypothetical protein
MEFYGANGTNLTKGADMEQLAVVFESLWQIVLALWDLVIQLLVLAMHYSLLIAWVAWWLLGVNWSKTWHVLARGAWAPVVLLVIISALVWSRIAPDEMSLGLAVIPNFWWQLGAVGLLVGVTLFCGWLQGIFHWAPAEVSFEPPAQPDPSHGHAHGHR